MRNAKALHDVVQALDARSIPIRTEIIDDGVPRTFRWSAADDRFVLAKAPVDGLRFTLLGPSKSLVKKHRDRLPVMEASKVALLFRGEIRSITASNQLSYIGCFGFLEQVILVSGDAGCVDFKSGMNSYHQPLLDTGISAGFHEQGDSSMARFCARAIQVWLWLVLLAALIAEPVAAQIVTTPPPARRAIDDNGVDVIHGTFNYSQRVISIGPESTGGSGVVMAYDALSRLTSETTFGQAVSYQYDAGSRRTRVTHPDSFYAQYDYDTLNLVTAIRENGASSGVGVLATYAYDNLGRRTSVTRGNGTVTSYGYDAVSRLNSLTQDLSGTVQDNTDTFTFTPASQIATFTRSNDTTYAWTSHYNVTRNYTNNGLNQHTAAGGLSFSYDTRGNLTGDGTWTFGYDPENRLTSTSGGASATLGYDPLGRLRQTAAGVTTVFLYSGQDLALEYNSAATTILRRYVHGAGTDEPIIWYEGSGTTDRRFLHADARGSIIAASNGSGASIATYRYGPYGEPDSTTGSRFRYTGQILIPELGLYHYKARVYSPWLGRFLQTDPIGYQDGMNVYAYTRNDPVNAVDPSGLESMCTVKGVPFPISGTQSWSEPESRTVFLHRNVCKIGIFLPIRLIYAVDHLEFALSCLMRPDLKVVHNGKMIHAAEL